MWKPTFRHTSPSSYTHKRNHIQELCHSWNSRKGEHKYPTGDKTQLEPGLLQLCISAQKRGERWRERRGAQTAGVPLHAALQLRGLPMLMPQAWAWLEDTGAHSHFSCHLSCLANPCQGRPSHPPPSLLISQEAAWLPGHQGTWLARPGILDPQGTLLNHSVWMQPHTGELLIPG